MATRPGRRGRAALGAGGLASLALLGWWGLGSGAGAPRAAAPPAAAPKVPSFEQLKLEIVATYPHDPGAFTQGLLVADGALYESIGLHGASALRRVELESGRVLAEQRLPAEIFAEGLAAVAGQLVQLTWQNGVALVWDRARFAKVKEHRYEGEGWGLCADGSRLVMSNGSDTLTFRDPATFAAVGSVEVTLAGRPVERLNELECVDGLVYANLWMEDDLVRIDPASGRVTALIDAAGLLTPAERAATDVLNGIAYRPEAGTFLVTGKLWPKLFEVRFVPKG